MSFATFDIEFVADIARLRKDLDEVKGMFSRAQNHIENAAGKLNSVLGALGVGLSVAAFGSWMKAAIDAGDQMKEFSQKTGVAVEDVAGLQLAFQQGNVGSEELSKAISKLSKNMADGSGAFKQLGVETRNSDGSLRDVKDVFYDVADATAAMADGAAKNALLQEVFGKSAAALIPTLNEGSAGLREMAEMADKLGLSMSAEAANNADKFNDTMELLGDSTKGIARQVMSELLPTLNSMAGAMLEGATQGDVLKNTATGISVVLKSLYTAFAIVSEYLTQVGKSLGAVAAMAVSALSGDFSGAAAIAKERMADMTTDVSARVESLGRVWSDSGDKTVESLAAVNKASKNVSVQTKEQEDAVKSADKAYQSLREKLNTARVELDSQNSSGAALTATQKQLALLTANNTDEVRKLSDARRQELIALAKHNVELENQAKAQEEARKAVEKATQEVVKKNASLDDEIQKQLESNAKLRDGVGASSALEVAKLREAAATAEKNAVTAQESSQNAELAAEYQKQADKLRELADLKDQGVHLEMAKQANEEWKKTTDQIEQGLTDSLMRGFENGKSFGDSFKDGLEAQFKALVLQPSIKAVMGPTSDILGGLMSGKPGALKGLTGSFGALGDVFKGNFGSVFGGGGLSGIMGGIGKLMPAVGIISAGASLIKSAFSMGEKKVTETGIDATISGDSFSGQTYEKWKQKGGLFRSNKKGVRYKTLDDEMNSNLQDTTMELYAKMEDYAKALGLPVEQMANVNYKMRVTLGKDEAENQKAIESAFSDYQNTLAAKFASVLSVYQQAGEDLADTMERLADLENMSQSLNQFGGVFSRIASLSVDAREQLADFAGGIDALISKTKTFVDAYYTDAEKAGLQSRDLVSQLSAAGIDPAFLQSKEQYRALVESTDVGTEVGRQMLATLLDVAPTFATLSEYLTANNLTLGQSASMAPQTALLQSLFDQTKTDSAAMVDQQAVTNQNLENIIEAIMSGNGSIVGALENVSGSMAEAIGRYLSSAGFSSSGRAVVAA